jgi:hypothetical protein
MSSVDDFCNELFSKDPERPGSVDLSVDVNEPSEYFEFLLLVMTNGLKRWLGDRINIADVMKTHIEKLKEYFVSFGMNIYLDIEEKPHIYSIDNKSYLNKTKLEDMKFTIESATHLYTVWFSFVTGAKGKGC